MDGCPRDNYTDYSLSLDDWGVWTGYCDLAAKKAAQESVRPLEILVTLPKPELLRSSKHTRAETK